MLHKISIRKQEPSNGFHRAIPYGENSWRVLFMNSGPDRTPKKLMTIRKRLSKKIYFIVFRLNNLDLFF